MMLAVDTSTDQIGIALGDGDQTIAEWIWRSQQYHTVELAPAIAELLRHAGVSMDSIEALSVAVGPGSYTALRVGLAVAKGMALARNLPLIGIPTLDVLAAGQPACGLPLGAVIRAGRGRIALGWYRSSSNSARNGLHTEDETHGDWRADGPAEVTTVDALAKSIDRPTLIAGELTTEERQRLARKKKNVVLAPPHSCLRRPSLLAEIGWRRYQSGQVDDTAALTPIYLHHAEPSGE